MKEDKKEKELNMNFMLVFCNFISYNAYYLVFETISLFYGFMILWFHGFIVLWFYVSVFQLINHRIKAIWVVNGFGLVLHPA